MARTVVSLTDAKIKSAISKQKKSPEKIIKLADGGGLFLLLDKKGGTYWRFDYFRPITKKRTTIGIGVYPNLSLADARKFREEYKELLAQDIDPFAHRKEQEEQARFAMRNTFEAVAREFMQTEVVAESTRHRNEFIYQYLFDAIGKKPIHEISARQLLDVCQIYEKQGKSETARRMRSKAGQVFKYGLVLGLCDRNVALDIQGLLKPHKKTHHAAVTDPNLLGELLVAIDNYTNRGSLVMAYALRILPHVFVRPGELRHAMWADINLDEKTWAYTPSKTANALGTQLVIPLSDQVTAMFKELHMITGGSEYCFANYWGKTRLLSDSSINKALKNLGWENGETTGHGFRATARTLLDEVLKFPIERIEQQLGHQVRDMHGRAYNRTKYLEERQVMMQAWSDYLDSLKVKALNA
ncbi:integrase arm-type DNA-binding domain-containing protein [Acinetobacter sp. YH01021]|uniref:tyrosine-type recombinase/integrase n=1 Tax=Acinetobacter sp. YH01021 TaxID=2601035 RepID=UPI0015D421BB|nr:integrase arm-type DNA-binding domain-containing protein [Acinetobacter sp. YH01021]